MATKKHRGKNEGSISRRPNGSLRAQITLPGGKRLNSPSFKTKSECLAWLRTTKDQIDKGLTYDLSKTTLVDYMNLWLSSIKASVRYTTWSQYRRVSEQHIFPAIGKIKIMDLKPDQIQRLYDHMLAHGIGRYVVLKTHSVLRSALSRAVKTGVISRNPALSVIVPKIPDDEMQILDEIQVNQLLMTAKGRRFEAFYHLAVTTGMRVMEMLGLRWVDVDWVRQTLKVERQLLRAHGQGIEFAAPKTKYGKRTIQLGLNMIETLRQHDNRQQQDRIAAGDQWQDHGLIFTTHTGAPLQYRNISRDYKQLLQDAGLPNIRIHDLRHTCASLMLNHNVPVIVVSRRLGHAKPSITLDIYGHLMSSAQTEVADLLDEMITPVELHQVAPDLHQSLPKKP